MWGNACVPFPLARKPAPLFGWWWPWSLENYTGNWTNSMEFQVVRIMEHKNIIRFRNKLNKNQQMVHQEMEDIQSGFRVSDSSINDNVCFHMLYGLPHSQRHWADKFSHKHDTLVKFSVVTKIFLGIENISRSQSTCTGRWQNSSSGCLWSVGITNRP